MEIEAQELERRFKSMRIRCKAMESRLAASLLQHGQQSPVVVVRDGDKRVLIDGYARCAALDELGRDLVDVVELELGIEEALLWRYRMVSSKRRSVFEDAWLVAELRDTFGLTQEEIGRRLMRSQSWVSRRLSLVQVLPAEAQQAIRDGWLPGRAAAVFLVPMTRVIREHCVKLVRNLGSKSISDRQVERLYKGWQRADDKERERIVTHPWLYLAAAEELEQPTPEPADAVEKMQRDLESAAGLCRRVRRTLRDGLVVPVERRAAVVWAWRDLERAVAELRRPIEETANAGQGHSDRGACAAPSGAGHTEDRAGVEDQPRCSEACAGAG